MNPLHNLSPYLITLHVQLSSHLPLSLNAVGWYAQDMLSLQHVTAQTNRELLREVQILIFLKM